VSVAGEDAPPPAASQAHDMQQLARNVVQAHQRVRARRVAQPRRSR
jgi:hypothetical protein